MSHWVLSDTAIRKTRVMYQCTQPPKHGRACTVRVPQDFVLGHSMCLVREVMRGDNLGNSITQLATLLGGDELQSEEWCLGTWPLPMRNTRLFFALNTTAREELKKQNPILDISSFPYVLTPPLMQQMHDESAHLFLLDAINRPYTLPPYRCARNEREQEELNMQQHKALCHQENKHRTRYEYQRRLCTYGIWLNYMVRFVVLGMDRAFLDIHWLVVWRSVLGKEECISRETRALKQKKHATAVRGFTLGKISQIEDSSSQTVNDRLMGSHTARSHQIALAIQKCSHQCAASLLNWVCYAPPPKPIQTRYGKRQRRDIHINHIENLKTEEAHNRCTVAAWVDAWLKCCQKITCMRDTLRRLSHLYRDSQWSSTSDERGSVLSWQYYEETQRNFIGGEWIMWSMWLMAEFLVHMTNPAVVNTIKNHLLANSFLMV